MSIPSAFISYSHDSADHKRWVHAFASDLVLAGINVTLDQWDLKLGADIVSFMNTGIARSDRVLLICSEPYVEKANSLTGGVGYESLVVSSEVARNITTTKFLPIVRANISSNKLPAFLGSRRYLDMNDDTNYANSLKECIHDLHNVPLLPKPQLGVFAGAAGPATRSAPQSLAPAQLTPREIDVLRWMMQGKTTWEISQLLAVSMPTVKFHIANLRSKLSATSKEQIAQRAQEHGLL